jgi:hypothetical protein
MCKLHANVWSFLHSGVDPFCTVLVEGKCEVFETQVCTTALLEYDAFRSGTVATTAHERSSLVGGQKDHKWQWQGPMGLGGCQLCVGAGANTF